MKIAVNDPKVLLLVSQLAVPMENEDYLKYVRSSWNLDRAALCSELHTLGTSWIRLDVAPCRRAPNSNSWRQEEKWRRLNKLKGQLFKDITAFMFSKSWYSQKVIFLWAALNLKTCFLIVFYRFRLKKNLNFFNDLALRHFL